MFRSVINSKQNYALDLLNKTHKNHLDVYKIELNPENALDILGICRK